MLYDRHASRPVSAASGLLTGAAHGVDTGRPPLWTAQNGMSSSVEPVGCSLAGCLPSRLLSRKVSTPLYGVRWISSIL